MRRQIRTAVVTAMGALALCGPAGAQGPADSTCGVTVMFNAGQSVIGRQARDVLIEYARDNPSAPMVITGYANSAGSPEANRALSLQRARSVAAALEGASIVSVTGEGATMRPGTTGPGDPANRRVEAVRRDCADARHK